MLSGLHGVSAIFAGRGFAFCRRVRRRPDFAAGVFYPTSLHLQWRRAHLCTGQTPPSGHRCLPISKVVKMAVGIKENLSPACGRGGGVRAFVRRTNHAKLDKQVFSPSSVAARHLPGTHEKNAGIFSWVPRLPQAGGGIVCGFLKIFSL